MTKPRWFLALGVALVVCGFEYACIKALSPHEEIKPETTTSVEADHSTVTQTTFNFSSVASKGGWIATPLTLLGWVVATIKMRRREQAADMLIGSIEENHCSDCKRRVRAKANAYVDRRVAKLTRVKP
jgi:hypothetical protein